MWPDSLNVFRNRPVFARVARIGSQNLLSHYLRLQVCRYTGMQSQACNSIEIWSSKGCRHVVAMCDFVLHSSVGGIAKCLAAQTL